ncbi:MAG: M28 family peptidase [Acidobacteria bacterium]|nr:M28 family peptidase [Acidobacteriota bacterium]
MLSGGKAAGLLGVVAAALLVPGLSAPSGLLGVSGFSGGRAFEDLKRIVALGPRPSGSVALAKTRQEISRQLKLAGLMAEEDNFTASTPVGPVPMTNVIVRIPGDQKKIVVVAGHYETKRFSDFRFVGANDGGSSAACLVELSRVLATRKNKFTYWLVFFDGEEAFGDFSETDGLYGSRHLVRKLAASGELSRLEAVIVVDMVADSDLNIHRENNSTPWLTDQVFTAARRLGYGRYFLDDPRYYIDDHVPFVNAGVAAVNLLDFSYGHGNRYWHTAEDTLDKCSPFSLTIVGRTVMATLEGLEQTLK